MPTHGRSRRVLVRIAAVAVGCAALVAASQLLAGASTGPRTGPSGTDGVLYGAPAAPGGGSATIPKPPSKNEDYGIQFDPVTTRVRRAKVRFTLPPLTFRSYLDVCYTSPAVTSDCPGHDLSKYPKLPFDYTWDVAFADNWVARRTHGTTSFGVFPPVRVSMLAFGGIPVTATAHLTQTVHDGLYDPMKLLLPVDLVAVPAGKSIPGYGPAPKFKQGTFFSYKGTVKGTVDIRLSDVTIDRVPLDVGSDCHTSSAAVLTLIDPAGYYPQGVSPLKLKGGPGEFQPLGGSGPAGYLQGNANVPAFTGCHNGGDDLDPLVTGMISGTHNPVNAYSPSGLQSWCLEPIAHCNTPATAQQQALLAARTPAQLRAALATPGSGSGLGRYVPPRP